MPAAFEGLPDRARCLPAIIEQEVETRFGGDLVRWLADDLAVNTGVLLTRLWRRSIVAAVMYANLFQD